MVSPPAWTRHLARTRPYVVATFLVLFLGALALGGVWNREHALRVEELGLLGIAFLLFYPLFLFGAGYIGRDAALCGAVAVVAVVPVPAGPPQEASTDTSANARPRTNQSLFPFIVPPVLY